MPVGGRHLLDRTEARRASVVVEDVKAIPRFGRELDPGLRLLEVAEIDGRPGDHLATLRAHHALGLLGAGPIQVTADHTRARGRELQRRLPPLAARGARYQRHLARQSSCSARHVSPWVVLSARCTLPAAPPVRPTSSPQRRACRTLRPLPWAAA